MGARYFIRNRGRYHELEDPAEAVVGRDPACEVPLDDPDTSRRHCRIVRQGPSLRVIDLDSRNGVRINGVKIVQQASLHHGDVLTVGTSHLSILVQTLSPVQADELPEVQEDEVLESTRATTNPLGVFADGAEEALAAGDMLVAEMSARNLVRSLRSLASRGRKPDLDLARRAFELSLDLAEATGDRVWLQEADALVRALDLSIPRTVLERRYELDVVI